MRHRERLWRVVPLIGLLAVAGCHTRRPDFMTRVGEDCAAGDQWACDLIDSLARPVPTETRDNVDPSGDRIDVTTGGDTDVPVAGHDGRMDRPATGVRP